MSNYTISIDMNKLFTRLREEGWKSGEVGKFYSCQLNKMRNDYEIPNYNPRYLAEVLSSLSSSYFLNLIQPGHDKDAFINKLIEEYKGV